MSVRPDGRTGARSSARRAIRAASEQVAVEIQHYIQREGLQPDDFLGREEDLAADFGVSRPTLREALRLLAGSHLIRASQGRGGGIFVANTAGEGMGRHMSEAIGAMLATESVSLFELLEARMVLEVPLAGLAAAGAGPETIAKLEQAIADAEGHRPGSETFNEADSRFHQTIAEASGNDVLIAFTRWILDVLLPSLIDYIGPKVSAEEILDQHRAILRAIRRSQSTAAERAMRDHLEHLAEIVRKLEPS